MSVRQFCFWLIWIISVVNISGCVTESTSKTSAPQAAAPVKRRITEDEKYIVSTYVLAHLKDPESGSFRWPLIPYPPKVGLKYCVYVAAKGESGEAAGATPVFLTLTTGRDGLIAAVQNARVPTTVASADSVTADCKNLGY